MVSGRDLIQSVLEMEAVASKPVLVAADQFMENDHDGQSHWIPLEQH